MRSLVLITILIGLLSLSTLSQGQGNRVTVWAEEHVRLMTSASAGFLAPPAIARAQAIVSTCMWDAVAPFTSTWKAVYNNVPRRPEEERTDANREIALSYAAYRCLYELYFPKRAALLSETRILLASQGLDPSDTSEDPVTPIGIGNMAARKVLEARQNDGSNEKGDEFGTKNGIYSDYTRYTPLNDPAGDVYATNCEEEIRSPGKWQPLLVPPKVGEPVTQTYAVPHWLRVKPFALDGPFEYHLTGPAVYSLEEDSEYYLELVELVNITSVLDDRMKAIALYWAGGPNTPTPSGLWMEFAIDLAKERELDLTETLSLLFLQTNAVLDAGIAVWAYKRLYDSVRPITAIQCGLAEEQVKSWQEPYGGVQEVLGSEWRPFQEVNFITPPFSEYPSGHSCFSASSAEVFRRFFGSDYFGKSVTIPAGSSLIEPRIVSGQAGYISGTTDVANSGPETEGYSPAEDITLTWETFTDAALEAGISRLYGGIHFSSGNEDSQDLGRYIGGKVWERYQELCCSVKETTDDSEPSSASSSSGFIFQLLSSF